MKNILVSACLLGKNCRYDTYNHENEKVLALKDKYNLVAICPEVMSGMKTPRNPAEQKDGKVFDNQGHDLTEQFAKGANMCLDMAKKHKCEMAILKSKSPSCGYGQVYDGTFSRNLISGNGVTAQLLTDNGIKVFTEKEFDL